MWPGISVRVLLLLQRLLIHVIQRLFARQSSAHVSDGERELFPAMSSNYTGASNACTARRNVLPDEG